MTTEQKVADILKDSKKTISVAESCTGGLLSSRITNIPGSSAFYISGIIAYSNDVKVKLLNVPQETINKHGAVSEETATAIAKNVRLLFKTDFGISITGIAGPDGGTVKKPVGLTFIAIATPDEILCIKCVFEGDRLSIKQQAASQALKLLLEFIE